jgi:hypothetical protein
VGQGVEIVDLSDTTFNLLSGDNLYLHLHSTNVDLRYLFSFIIQHHRQNVKSMADFIAKNRQKIKIFGLIIARIDITSKSTETLIDERLDAACVIGPQLGRGTFEAGVY